MEAIYARTDGSVSDFVPAFELAEELGIDGAEAARAIAYLEEKGWVSIDDHRAGILRITADGVDWVETSPDADVGLDGPAEGV